MFEDSHFAICPRASFGIYCILRQFYDGSYVAVNWNVCPDVIFAIILAGKKPYFVNYGKSEEPLSEVDLRSIPSEVQSLIHVHTYGYFRVVTKNMRNRFSLIIDDAAQASGTSFRGVHAGFAGDFGIFSFGNSKQIDLGGGGLVHHNNPKVINEIQTFIYRSKFLSSEEFSKIYAWNHKIIFSKILLFEKNQHVDWLAPNLDPRVVLKNFQNVKSKRCLINSLATYKADVRITAIQSFLEKTKCLTLEYEDFLDHDNLWRITITPVDKDFEKYILVFKQLRKENYACSNWYYPANLIFGEEEGSELLVSADKLMRFQFSIQCKEGRYVIPDQDRIFDILKIYYG